MSRREFPVQGHSPGTVGSTPTLLPGNRRHRSQVRGPVHESRPLEGFVEETPSPHPCVPWTVQGALRGHSTWFGTKDDSDPLCLGCRASDTYQSGCRSHTPDTSTRTTPPARPSAPTHCQPTPHIYIHGTNGDTYRLYPSLHTHTPLSLSLSFFDRTLGYPLYIDYHWYL